MYLHKSSTKASLIEKSSLTFKRTKKNLPKTATVIIKLTIFIRFKIRIQCYWFFVVSFGTKFITFCVLCNVDEVSNLYFLFYCIISSHMPPVSIKSSRKTFLTSFRYINIFLSFIFITKCIFKDGVFTL